MSEEQCCKRSLLGSLWDSAKKVVADPIPIPPTAQAERLLLCNKCEKFKDGICEECGCVMRLKTQFAEMECPLGKWGKHKAR